MTRRGDSLGVWMDGLKVAEVVAADSIGNISCRYSDEALARWPRNSPVLSCSLPLSDGVQPATPFFRGLLPEGDALRVLAERAGVATTDTFALLDRYGRDVAGALVIGSDAPDIDRYEIDLLDDDRLGVAVDGLPDNPLGADDQSELSLDGLQDKLLLVKAGSGWGRPLHGMPSTHILKADDPIRPGLVAAEYLCLRLAIHIGLTPIEAELVQVADRDCLIVSRFDRDVENGQTVRLHQEDLCQASGVDPSAQRGRAKYESHGGPGFREMAQLLDMHAVDPGYELDRLVSTIVFTVLIGNADGHAKNLGLLHETPESVSLAPVYDTVPTVLWPKLRTSGAMAIGGQPELADVTLASIRSEARRWHHLESRAETIAVETVEELLTAVAEGVVPADSAVAAQVLKRGRELLA